MCRMCLRSRSCDFYVKLKFTCKTLISLPFVCNNGTVEKMELKVDISNNNSVSFSRFFVGQDFSRVTPVDSTTLKFMYLESFKSDNISGCDIHYSRNRCATKNKDTSMVPFGRNSSVWFPKHFQVIFVNNLYGNSIKVVIDSNNGR